MILTVTLNPSLDRTIEVATLRRGSVLRAASARLDPGGKGVNVSRALLANGVKSRAVVCCGGDEGEQLIRLLAAEGVEIIAVPVAGSTRSNVAIAEPDGTVTKINEPGPALSPAELDAVADAVLGAAGSADRVVASGSLPPDVPVDVYARLCRRFAAAGIRVAVDTSGPALMSAVGAGADLVKPNREELSEAVGAPLRSLGDVVAAAGQLHALGARAVLASLGRDGAMLLDAGGVVFGEAPLVARRSTVGAGDALLAGYLASEASGAAALAEALAWGAAAVGLPGSRMPGPADLRREAVHIHRKPDLSQPLSGSV